MIELVDTQVNFGKSVFGPDCNPDVYDTYASNIGVTRALVMPTLTHEVDTGRGIERSCIWSVDDGVVRYRRELKVGDVWVSHEVDSNPYGIMNRSVLAKVRGLNKHSPISYYFLPKFHPVLDSRDELEGLLREEESVGIKINGLTTYCSPVSVPDWLPEVANNFGVPVFVHTDFYNRAFEDDRLPDYLKDIICQNTPMAWLSWAKSSGIEKVFFAHLGRMDEEFADEVRKDANFMVGIGPDYQLQDEPIRLKQSTDNILREAMRLFGSGKLCYNTDYAWNVFDRRDWSKFDWDTHNRLAIEANLDGSGEDAIASMLANNAINFFRLNDFKVK